LEHRLMCHLSSEERCQLILLLERVRTDQQA